MKAQTQSGLAYLVKGIIADSVSKKVIEFAIITVSLFGGYVGQTVVTNAAEFHSTLASRYLMRSVRLSLDWEFGSMFKTVKTRKVANVDQKNVKSAG